MMLDSIRGIQNMHAKVVKDANQLKLELREKKQR